MNARLVKYTTIAFLLIGFAFTSTSALSYWRDVTVVRDVELVTIGTPVEIIIDDLNEDAILRQLVPYGYIYSVNDVDQITLEYEVSISKELLNSVNLYINVENIQIDGLDQYTQLVDITVLGSKDEVVLDLYNSTILVTLVVRLIEPIDMNEAIEGELDLELVNVEDSQEAFNDIQGKDITFSLVFELETKEVPTEETIDEQTTETPN